MVCSRHHKSRPRRSPQSRPVGRRIPVSGYSVSGRQRGINGARSGLFLRLLNSSKAKTLKIDPHGLSLKMLRISCPFMEDGTLRPFSIRWPHSATISNTDCSIQSISAPLKIESECSLSLADILDRTRTQNISCPRRQWQSSYPTHRWYAGQRVYDPAGISVTMAAQSGGWGGKTGLYFVDFAMVIPS